jgi:hypothetical protein
MHHNHHEIRAMAREQEQDRLREARAWSRGTKLPSRVPGTLKRMLAAIAVGVGIAPGGLIRRAFCRILGSTMRRIGFGLVRSGRRLARIA